MSGIFDAAALAARSLRAPTANLLLQPAPTGDIVAAGATPDGDSVRSAQNCRDFDDAVDGKGGFVKIKLSPQKKKISAASDDAAISRTGRRREDPGGDFEDGTGGRAPGVEAADTEDDDDDTDFSRIKTLVRAAIDAGASLPSNAPKSATMSSIAAGARARIVAGAVAGTLSVLSKSAASTTQPSFRVDKETATLAPYSSLDAARDALSDAEAALAAAEGTLGPRFAGLLGLRSSPTSAPRSTGGKGLSIGAKNTLAARVTDLEQRVAAVSVSLQGRNGGSGQRAQPPASSSHSSAGARARSRATAYDAMRVASSMKSSGRRMLYSTSSSTSSSPLSTAHDSLDGAFYEDAAVAPRAPNEAALAAILGEISERSLKHTEKFGSNVLADSRELQLAEMQALELELLLLTRGSVVNAGASLLREPES